MYISRARGSESQRHEEIRNGRVRLSIACSFSANHKNDNGCDLARENASAGKYCSSRVDTITWIRRGDKVAYGTSRAELMNSVSIASDTTCLDVKTPKTDGLYQLVEHDRDDVLQSRYGYFPPVCKIETGTTPRRVAPRRLVTVLESVTTRLHSRQALIERHEASGHERSDDIGALFGALLAERELQYMYEKCSGRGGNLEDN